MRTFFFYFFSLSSTILSSLYATNSVVFLDSGEKLIGEVLPISNQEILVLRSPVLGELQFLRKRISSIHIEPPESENTPLALTEPKAEKPENLNLFTRKQEMDAEIRVLENLKRFNAPDHWSGNLRFGMNFNNGDRRYSETYARGKLEISPENSPHFYRLAGSYTYRETERPNGDLFKTKDKYDAQFVYRREIQGNWFVQNSLSGRVDKIKRINRKVQGTIGMGYIYKPYRSLEFVLGGGGGIEHYDAELGDTRASRSSLLNIFQEAVWSPLERTSFIQGFNYYWNPNNNDLYSYTLTMAVRIRLTDLLGFEFSFNRTFDNDLGDSSVKNDAQLRNALVIYF